MASALVRTARRDVGAGAGSVVEITFSDPVRRNALSARMLDELTNAFHHAVEQRTRVAILRTEPGATTWSSGSAIDELPMDGSDPLAWSSPLEEFLQVLRSTPFPVIACVEGGVWGGAVELVLTCDLVIATRTSTFAITPARLGVPYNTEGVARVLAMLPLAVAKEMFFTADPLGAPTWFSHGVVARLVDGQVDLALVADELAARIAQRAPLTIRAVKAEMLALTSTQAMGPEDAERLTELRHAAWMSEDYREGIRAFQEKRPPVFRGR